MKRIDLHVHSNYSDGTMTPAGLVRHAAGCGLAAFALTDHDSTDGIEEAMAAAEAYCIEVIPGIEFSTQYQKGDIHILGLEADWRSPLFQERIAVYRGRRMQRNREIIRRMTADGIDITWEKMAAAFGEVMWTRAHFARYLTEHGYASEMWEAFDAYLNQGCRYYVPRQKITPFEVTELIRSCGGIPVLAHPLQYKLQDDELRLLLRKLKDSGLLGMEVYYSTHTRQQTEELLALAQELELLPSGGSDFHGENKPLIALGSGKNNLQIPYRILEDLRRKKQK